MKFHPCDAWQARPRQLQQTVRSEQNLDPALFVRAAPLTHFPVPGSVLELPQDRCQFSKSLTCNVFIFSCNTPKTAYLRPCL